MAGLPLAQRAPLDCEAMAPLRHLLALLALAAACAEAPESTAPLELAACTLDGQAHLRWTPIPGRLLLNEEFSVQVEVTDAGGAPVEGASVQFQAEMPGHGHGMLREPSSHELGNGLYRVDGVLLHMEGEWLVHLDVVVSGIASRVDFEVRVP